MNPQAIPSAVETQAAPGAGAGTAGASTTAESTASPIYDWQSFGFETRQVHAGEYPDKNHGLRVPPIALSAGYLFDDFDDQVNRFNGSIHWRAENDGPRGEGEAFSPSEHAPIYSRQGNPSNWVAEERLASLEGGTVAVAVASEHPCAVRMAAMAASTTPTPCGVGLRITEIAATENAATSAATSSKPKA